MFEPASYGPQIAGILAEAERGRRPMPLVIGPCVSEPARQKLRQTSGEALFAPRPVVSADFGELVRSGLFVYLSCFDDSHRISQDIASTTASFWHGILHRLEPDYSNARYWFHRVGDHPILAALHQAAVGIAPDLAGGRWDPFRFIEACEQASRAQEAGMVRQLEALQEAEWQLLFDYSYRQAVAAP